MYRGKNSTSPADLTTLLWGLDAMLLGKLQSDAAIYYQLQ